MSKYQLKYEFLNLSDPTRFFKPDCNSFSVKNTGTTNIHIVVAGSAALLVPNELMKFSANHPEVVIINEFDFLPEVPGTGMNCLIIKEFINAI